MNNKHYLIILLIMNLALIAYVYLLKKEITEYKTGYSSLHFQFYDNENNLINPVQHNYNRIIYEDTTKNITDFSVIAFFDTTYCPSCIVQEVQQLNKFNKEYPGRLVVYCNSKTYLYQYNTDFEVNYIKSTDNYFEPKIKTSLPFMCLVDKNRVVLEINKIEENVIAKSIRFFDKVKTIING